MVQVRLVSMQWWIQHWQLRLSVNLLLKAVSLARALSGTFSRLPHYVDIVAYDKTQKKKKSQTNFLPYYYFIILSFVLKKRICFMDKKKQGGKVSVFTLALLVCHPPSRDKEKSS